MPPAARSSLLLILLALGAAGCFGGSSQATSGPASSPYHSRALAVCRHTQQEVVALGSPGAVSTLPALAARGAKLVALQRREIAQLQALQPPASDAAQVHAALAAMQAATEASAQLVSYARAGDPGAVTAQQKIVTSAVAAANRALVPLGLNTCSS
jgi:hypothetical protein